MPKGAPSAPLGEQGGGEGESQTNPNRRCSGEDGPPKIQKIPKIEKWEKGGAPKSVASVPWPRCARGWWDICLRPAFGRPSAGLRLGSTRIDSDRPRSKTLRNRSLAELGKKVELIVPVQTAASHSCARKRGRRGVLGPPGGESGEGRGAALRAATRIEAIRLESNRVASTRINLTRINLTRINLTRIEPNADRTELRPVTEPSRVDSD